MGAGASSAANAPNGRAAIPPSIPLKRLPECIEEAIYVHEKFPLIVDTTEQAARFLKYQLGSFYDLKDPTISKQQLNRSLVGALQHGRTMTLKIPSFDEPGLEARLFEPSLFPKEVLNRALFFNDDCWRSVLKKELGDADDITISAEFSLVICSVSNVVPSSLAQIMHIVNVDDNPNGSSGAAGDGSDEQEDGEVGMMAKVAACFGAVETVRNSTKLVEAAFDGELEELKGWLEKGYHIESTDGRKHTALSEAASQGHMEIVKFLIAHGADPNARNDTGRSALWRAAFNGHFAIVEYLLSVGADADGPDRVSMESAYDVAKSQDIRDLLSGWDREVTVRLIEARRKVILANIEQRIRTAAEREEFARHKIRLELIEKAEAGDWDGIKEMLHMIADEAEASDAKPRASAEVRNETGMSLLGIAAKHNHEHLAEMLLTYWKTLDKDKIGLAEGEISKEAKVFKANPNSRDLKGWTCTCIAVFHESGKVLGHILENGGDPSIRSSYNKNAWDLAKDELDAAENVVRSRAEIRQVLIDYDTTQVSKLFGTGASVKATPNVYQDLGPDGSSVVMQLEMHQTMALEADEVAAKGKNGGNKKSKDGAAKPKKKAASKK